MEHLVSDTASLLIRISDLLHNKPTQFEIVADEKMRADIAEALNVPAVKKLKLSGQIAGYGNKDWKLKAALGATVVQSCVITLEPVTTRIDETVVRTYVSEFVIGEGSEIELPEDDSLEAIPSEIDLQDLIVEALEIALPAYPKKDGAELGEAVFTEPGNVAMTDEDAKPFSSLSGLRDALKNNASGRDK